jgi:endonuclease/exonuclease/phosphatase family metal-dependent hydrolase
MRWWFVIGIAAVVSVRACRHDAATPLRFATFNIEDFPKNARQVAGAFDEIRRLDASFVGVQEIGDPELFAAQARERLGDAWQFAHINSGPLAHRSSHPAHHLGVVFDTRVWTFVSMAAHDETRLELGRHKPTLEVRLRDRAGDAVRVLVVHLKAGGDGRDIRARQYEALAKILSDVKRWGERVVLLGDFNATNAADRADLEVLARDTGMVWATRDLACSAFWSRDDGCPTSRLDHVLTWSPPSKVEAAGACETDGCEWHDRCPLYAEQVSDHCPVVVTF